VSGVVCVVCHFAGDENLENIHVDLALLVWSPTLLSTHAPLTPWTHPSPSFFFPLPSPPLFFSFSFFCSFFPRFLFVLLLFFSFFFVLTPPSLFFSFPIFLTLSTFSTCVCVCVCVYRCMYVSAYLAIPCVLANDNVKHIKSNIRYVFYKKINEMNSMWNI